MTQNTAKILQLDSEGKYTLDAIVVKGGLLFRDKIPLPLNSPLLYHNLTTWRSPVKDDTASVIARNLSNVATFV